MFCTKCGHGNADGAAFCSSCGSPLSANTIPVEAPQGQQPSAQQPVIPPQQINYVPPTSAVPPQGQYGQGGYYPPQQPYQAQGSYAPYPAQKKKKTGLIVGLTVGGVVLIAAVLVLLFVWPGLLNQSTSVTGIWYSEDRGEALEFKEGGSIRVYTVTNEFKGDYTYSNGMGTITVEDDEYRFAVSEDGLYVEDMGNYTKAEEDFDIGDFIDDMAPENASAVTDNAVIDNAAIDDVIGDDAIVDDGVVDDTAVDDTTADAGMAGADILGLWYESTGYAGTIEFYNDGSFLMEIVGVEYTGTYQFDSSTGTGTINDPISGELCNMTIYEDGSLLVDTIYYIRDYVEPLDLGDLGVE